MNLEYDHRNWKKPRLLQLTKKKKKKKRLQLARNQEKRDQVGDFGFIQQLGAIHVLQ